ncbi:MAG: AsmA family protein [Hyphomicrobiaceae bacterium]
MPSNDWSSREPPDLGPAPLDRRAGGARSPSPRPELAQSGFRQPARQHRTSARHLDYGYPIDRGGGFGRKAIYAFLALVALLAIGLGVLVVAPPVDLVRAHVVAEVERQTGRKLTMGSAGVSFASGFGVSLDGVALSAPPGMGGAPLLTAERIEVSLALLALVMREVKIDRLTLVRPVLDLRVDREGRRSWQFAALGPAVLRGTLRYAEAPGRKTDAAGLPSEVVDFMRDASPPRRKTAAGLDALSLADVRVVGGTLRYANARSALAQEVTGIDATLSLPSVDGPLKAKGMLTLAGEREAVDLQLDDIRGLLADRTVAVRAVVEGKALNLSFNGRIAAGAKSLKEGSIAIRAPSVARLARALGLPVTGDDGVGAVSLEGQLRATDESVMLTSAKIAAGQSSGTGTLGVETGGERPRLIANMRFAALHIDQLSSIRWNGDAPAILPEVIPPASAGRFALPAASPSSSTEPPHSIGDLLEREDLSQPATSPAARVKGFRKRLGNEWEVDAIDVAPLRAIDVEARFHIVALHTEKLVAEDLQTGVELKGGVLRLSLTGGRVGGGAVRGLASIDARQAAMTVGANLSGENVGLKPLLGLAGIDLIDGNGRLIVAVSAQGASERELVSTLAGRAEVKVSDGALVGWDAEAIAADLARGHMPTTERRTESRTPFKELSGNFHIAQGVARSRDLKLDSKSVAASGTATVNIVDRNVDILLKPRVAEGGLEVPVRIAGAWDHPRLVADVSSAMKSPQAKEAVRQLKDGNVEGALRSVLGSGPKADKKIDQAKDLLRGLLGR